MEKLFLNMVPVHELTWPPELSHADIEDLAGNTMHLKAVGHAMLIALALVKWGLDAERRPGEEEPVRKAGQPRYVLVPPDSETRHMGPFAGD